MNIPDIDGDDGQLVVHYNSRDCHITKQQWYLILMPVRYWLIFNKVYKSPSCSINNYAEWGTAQKMWKFLLKKFSMEKTLIFVQWGTSAVFRPAHHMGLLGSI